MANKWSGLNIKEKIAIITACAAFVIGWGLSICGFIVPPLGEVADSVLWILGQALIYSASVFGVTSYFSAESARLRTELDERIMRFEKLKEEEEGEDERERE